MTKKDRRSRKWQITINNPNEHDMSRERIVEIISGIKKILYYALSDEIGENGTYHTHLYIVAENAIRFSTLKNKFPKVHLEIARGSSAENRDYIFKQGKWLKGKKSETNLVDTHIECGEIPLEAQGTRNDLETLYDMIQEGMSDFEILHHNPEHMLKLDKIERARQVIKEAKYRKVFRELEVKYIFGHWKSLTK